MKKILVLILLTIGNYAFSLEANKFSNVFDRPFKIKKIMYSKIINLSVDINKVKLKFTNKGYGSIYLVKIIVPELAKETFLNHRNIGESGPCLYTLGTKNINDIIQDDAGVENIDFTIKLSKNTFLNNQNICKVTLFESMSATIRGYKFVHQKSTSLPDRVAADCK